MDWNQEITAIYPEMVSWRRYLHQHPELSFQEKNTSQWIYEQLTAWGIQAKRGQKGYQITATIQGGAPGPTIALRADIDGLPIQDEKKVEYASTKDGVMHACGHDAHTAVLLATAKLLHTHRHRLSGNVRLIFQHAEELCPGGALTVIEEGALEGVERIYGIHLWAPLPFGKVATRAGALMASADQFSIEVRGKGGHGGLPHEAVDSIVIGSHLIVNLQSIVSRAIDPLAACVVSVGSMQAGESFNAIAETCVMKGTVRSFSEQVRQQASVQIERIAHQTASMFSAEAQIAYRRGYPPLLNDPAEAKRVQRIAGRLFGAEHVRSDMTVMAAEDFAYYLQQVPGCFFFVGAGRTDGRTVPHHHPAFDIEEKAMQNAVRLFLALVEDAM